MAALAETSEQESAQTDVKDHQSLLHDRYAVEFDRRLPAMDTAGADAFACTDIRESDQPVYALVPKDGMPLRDEVLRLSLAKRINHVLTPVAAGQVSVPKGWVQAVILPFPLGGALFDPAAPEKLGEGYLRNRLLPQLVEGLEALNGREITHRGIRPDRLYFQDKARSTIMFSECVSELPAFSQPAAFEPIERATAHPAGRGEGDFACDLFALGATIFTLVTGRMPGEGVSAEQFLENRIKQGSYLAFASGTHIRGAFGALIRGLLCDEPDQRWGIEQIKRWLDGVMPPEPISYRRYALASEYEFNGRTYADRRLMAAALHTNFDAGIRELSNANFQAWIMNAVKEEGGTEAIEKLFDNPKQKGRNAAPKRLNAGTLSKVIQVLDPKGPLRYRSLCFMADGLAGFLAHASATQDAEHLKDLAEMCSGRHLRDTAELADGAGMPLRGILSDFAETERLAGLRGTGNGLERCLYQLNSGLPCQSPRLDRFHVLTPRELLMALEQLAGEDPNQPLLLDQHMAAFCASQSGDAASAVNAVARADHQPKDKVIATLGLLALLQRGYCRTSLPALARHIAAKLQPAIRDLHHIRTREALNKRIDQLAADGDLSRFNDELNFHTIRTRDEKRFLSAQKALKGIERQMAAVERGFQPTDPITCWYGERFAMLAAYVVAALSGFFTYWTAF